MSFFEEPPNPADVRDALEQAKLHSADVGVRWQAQMEEHLAVVRECNTMLQNMSHLSMESIGGYAMQAGANATAALALAVANVSGDLEGALKSMREWYGLGQEKP